MPSLSLSALRRLKTPEHVEALLAAGTLHGDDLVVSREDWVRLGERFNVPRQPLGQAVDAAAEARRGSGCYDGEGRLVLGSPCARRLESGSGSSVTLPVQPAQGDR